MRPHFSGKIEAATDARWTSQSACEPEDELQGRPITCVVSRKKGVMHAVMSPTPRSKRERQEIVDDLYPRERGG